MILVPSKLTERHKAKIKSYKYLCSDNFPNWCPRNFGMNPVWEWMARCMPSWVSPNMVTIVGYLFMLSYYCLNCYYNPGLDRPQDLPKWVFIYAGIVHVVGYWFDAVDGKLARLQGSSSVVGEVFDHTIDSLCHFQVCIFMVSSLTHVPMMQHPLTYYFMLFGPVVQLTALMIKKQFQKVVVFPWTAETSHYSFLGVCLYTGFSQDPLPASFIFYVGAINQMGTWISSVKDLLENVRYDRKSKFGTTVFWAFLPFAVNYALFITLERMNGIFDSTSQTGLSTSTIRWYLLLFQMKNACLVYRSIFAQNIDFEAGLWNRKLVVFFGDVVMAVYLSSLYRDDVARIDLVLKCAAIFSVFQFLFGLVGLCRRICSFLGINFLKVNIKNKKT